MMLRHAKSYQFVRLEKYVCAALSDLLLLFGSSTSKMNHQKNFLDTNLEKKMLIGKCSNSNFLCEPTKKFIARLFSPFSS